MKRKLIMMVLFAYLIIFLIFPLVVLLFDGINLETLTPNFLVKLKEALKNSIFISLIATVISIIISYVVASLIVKNHYKRKNLILMFLTLPMLAPTFTHAIGFIAFWGKNGLINNLFGTNINIYGFLGILLCFICYGVPLSLIMFVDLLASENHVPYNVARTLCIPKFNQCIKIKIPYIAKPTLFILFTVFTMVITDYSIPMMIGGNTVTLTTILYEQIVGRLNFGNGAIICIMLLVPAIIMFIIGLFVKSHDNFELRLDNEDSSNKIFKKISIIIYILVFLLISLPMISCVLIAFVKKFPLDLSFSLVHVQRVFRGEFLKYLINSLMISAFSSIFGTLIAFLFGYIATRASGKKISKIFHLLAIFTSSVPGIVLAVSYMFAFNKSIIYGTIIILIIINIVRYMGMPYLIFFNKLDNIDKTVETTGLTLGIPTKSVIIDVIIPQIIPSIIEAFCYIFVNTMASVTTMLFLATTFNKPLALAIVEFEANNFLEMAAFISLIILTTNFCIKALTFFSNKRQLQQHI